MRLFILSKFILNARLMRHNTLNSKNPNVLGMMPLFVANLTYTSSGTTLINNLSFSLGGAGITVVMGPNGAGKSILLRLLHGLIQPSSGEILWSGQAITSEIIMRQAMVFQKPVLLRRSVAENIDFVLRCRGVHSRAHRNQLLKQAGLIEKATQPARLLSGGEQQRLALVRALSTKPEVLFLDEPTASLDPTSALKIEEIVQETVSIGTRTILVTHDIGQAKRLANDVIFLHRGRLAEHANASVFFKNPVSHLARDYLAGRLIL